MPEFTFGGAYALSATDSFVKLKSGPFATNPGPPLARVRSQDEGVAKPLQLVRQGRQVPVFHHDAGDLQRTPPTQRSVGNRHDGIFVPPCGLGQETSPEVTRPGGQGAAERF